ncbi:MAG: hypothetical protein R3C44_07910 [Chloroflexota bacterium]
MPPATPQSGLLWNGYPALGKPIATLPKIQRQIGEIDAALQAARALLFEVAELWTGEE